MKAKYYILGFLTALVILMIAITGYLAGKNTTNENHSGDSLPTSQPTTYVPSPTPTPKILTTDDVRESIIAALESKNYLGLKYIVAPTVSMRIEAAECCGILSADELISKLDYLAEATGPWDFDDTSNIVINLKSAYPANYGNAIIGVSRDNYLAAFQLDSDNKISSVSLASDYKILLP